MFSIKKLSCHIDGSKFSRVQKRKFINAFKNIKNWAGKRRSPYVKYAANSIKQDFITITTISSRKINETKSTNGNILRVRKLKHELYK